MTRSLALSAGLALLAACSGSTDAADGCAGAPETDAARCVNGVDDDCDGRTDCADPDCAAVCPSCDASGTVEVFDGEERNGQSWNETRGVRVRATSSFTLSGLTVAGVGTGGEQTLVGGRVYAASGARLAEVETTLSGRGTYEVDLILPTPLEMVAGEEYVLAGYVEASDCFCGRGDPHYEPTFPFTRGPVDVLAGLAGPDDALPANPNLLAPAITLTICTD